MVTLIVTPTREKMIRMKVSRNILYIQINIGEIFQGGDKFCTVFLTRMSILALILESN